MSPMDNCNVSARIPARKSSNGVLSPRLMTLKVVSFAEKPETALARKSRPPNGKERLEEALATLNQNQAAFVGGLSENQRRHLELKRESYERFARIEAQMAEIIRVLSEHGRLLERLPEAIREKTGFKHNSKSVEVAYGVDDENPSMRSPHTSALSILKAVPVTVLRSSRVSTHPRRTPR